MTRSPIANKIYTGLFVFAAIVGGILLVGWWMEFAGFVVTGAQ